MADKYWKKHFKMIFNENHCDVITVEKFPDSDWSHISMNTNGKDNGKLTIRSKEMAEQLHFTLGQLLKED